MQVLDRVKLSARLVSSDDDTEELALMTRQLLREIEDRDLADAQQQTTDAPHGSKSGSLTILGAFAVSTAANLIPLVLDYFRRWCERRQASGDAVTIEIATGNRTVKLEIAADTSDDALKEYLALIAAHAPT